MSGTEWISLSERLPKEGEIVRIKVGPVIKENVLFRDGRFWRLRAADGSGQAHEPDAWAPMEKKIREPHAD